MLSFRLITIYGYVVTRILRTCGILCSFRGWFWDESCVSHYPVVAVS